MWYSDLRSARAEGAGYGIATACITTMQTLKLSMISELPVGRYWALNFECD